MVVHQRAKCDALLLQHFYAGSPERSMYVPFYKMLQNVGLGEINQAVAS